VLHHHAEKIVPYSYASVNEHMQRWLTPGVELLLIMKGKRKEGLANRLKQNNEE
jgi:hypothetical protein